MKITNEFNLPGPIYQAICSGLFRPDPEKISATQLIDPPLIRYLKMKHWDEIEIDASTRIWSLLGSLIHVLLSKQSFNVFTEEKLQTEVNGVKITGSPDLLDETGIITDYKLSSVWTYLYESRQKEYEKQLNIYRYLYQKNGFDIKGLQVVMILRDWAQSKTKNVNYPQCQVLTIPIKIWTMEQVETYIKERIKIHMQKPVPVCSEEERWPIPLSYKVLKKGRRTAIKVFPDYVSAKNFLEKQNDRHLLRIESAGGVYRRCENYCEVRKFCPVYNGAGKEMQSRDVGEGIKAS